MKELLIYLVLNIMGIVFAIILDTRKHIGPGFQPAIWLRDNSIRMLYIIATLAVINTVVFLAPGVEAFLSSFIEIKAPLDSPIGQFAMSLMTSLSYITTIKKPSLID